MSVFELTLDPISVASRGRRGNVPEGEKKKSNRTGKHGNDGNEKKGEREGVGEGRREDETSYEGGRRWREKRTRTEEGTY